VVWRGEGREVRARRAGGEAYVDSSFTGTGTGRYGTTAAFVY
jgi:hypothetical protein